VAKPDARKLKSEAGEAVRKGDFRRALDRYQRLEQLDPRDAMWCCRSAEMHRRLGEKQEELRALARGAERYARAGFHVKAIAVCRMILEVDPSHAATQARLAELLAARGLSPARRPAPAPASPAQAPVPQTGAPLGPGSAGDVIELDRVIDGGDSPEPAGVRRLALERPVEARSIPAPPRAAAAARDLLPKTPLFGALPAWSLEKLIGRLRLVSLAEGHVLFREGDPGDALYVVVEGALTADAERPTPRRLGLFQEGDFFGEIALVSEEPRVATVRALVDAQLLAIDPAAVRELVRDDPDVRAVLLGFLRERLVDRLVRTSPLFSGVAKEERIGIARAFEFLDVAEGAELVRQGEPAGRLFLSLAGSFEVVTYDGLQQRTVAFLAPGDVFGEMSLLDGGPAMATVQARTRSYALALGEARFRELAEAHPALLAAIEALAEQRRQQNEDSERALRERTARRIDLV
jgi:CRP-like cAMP-binding protein